MIKNTNKEPAGSGGHRVATHESHRTMKMAFWEAEGIPHQIALRLSGQATPDRLTRMDATGHINEENYVAYEVPTSAQKRSVAMLTQQAFETLAKSAIGETAPFLAVKTDQSTKKFVGIDGGIQRGLRGIP